MEGILTLLEKCSIGNSGISNNSEEVSICIASISWEDPFVKIRNKALISSSLIISAILILDSYVARKLRNTIKSNPEEINDVIENE